MADKMLTQLVADIEALYQQVADGLGVNTAQALRLEGQAAMLLANGIAQREALEQLCQQAYKTACGAELDRFFWQWSHDKNKSLADMQQPVFMIPIKDKEAPVYKG